jgi:adenosylhomocysteine nucleosidase
MLALRPALRVFTLTITCAAATSCAAATAGRRPAEAKASAQAPVDVVIQGAVDAEVTPLVESLEDATRVQIASWTFWRGRLGDKTVVVSRTEVGPINAVAATTLAIRTFQPRLIVNQGTAGATSPDLRVFDIIVGEATVDYGGFSTMHAEAGDGSNQDLWMRMPHRLRLGGEERVALPVFPCDPEAMTVALAQPNPHGRVIRGVIGSAFQFNREVDRLLWIRERYEAVSEDMESAFAGGTALGFDTPFLAVRIISDSDFYSPGVNPDAAGHCARFVASLVAQLPTRPGSPRRTSVPWPDREGR